MNKHSLPALSRLERKVLAEEQDEFTNEGAPPPGVVGTDLPRTAAASPDTAARHATHVEDPPLQEPQAGTPGA